MQETVEYLAGNLEELRGNYICVSNVHTTMTSFRDPDYNTVQNSGAMALPDGKPLVIVCRMRNFLWCRKSARAGSDAKDFEISREKGYRHYFTGVPKRPWGDCGQR